MSGSEYFFVLRDLEFLQRFGQEETEKCLLEFASDVLAHPTSSQVHVVRQSDLMARVPALREYVNHAVTARQLFNAHAERKQLLKGDPAALTVTQLLFPMESLCTYFALRAGEICMNDDNTRFVSFGNRIAKKINNLRRESLLVPPVLLTGTPSRILGPDYRKMSNRNANVLSYRAEAEQLPAFVRKLFKKSIYFSAFPDEFEIYKPNPSTYQFGPRFLPYSYLEALGHPYDFETGGSVMGNFEGLRQRLTAILVFHLERWREARAGLTRTHVVERLEQAKELAAKTAAPLNALF